MADYFDQQRQQFGSTRNGDGHGQQALDYTPVENLDVQDFDDDSCSEDGYSPKFGQRQNYGVKQAFGENLMEDNNNKNNYGNKQNFQTNESPAVRSRPVHDMHLPSKKNFDGGSSGSTAFPQNGGNPGAFPGSEGGVLPQKTGKRSIRDIKAGVANIVQRANSKGEEYDNEGYSQNNFANNNNMNDNGLGRTPPNRPKMLPKNNLNQNAQGGINYNQHDTTDLSIGANSSDIPNLSQAQFDDSYNNGYNNQNQMQGNGHSPSRPRNLPQGQAYGQNGQPAETFHPGGTLESVQMTQISDSSDEEDEITDQNLKENIRAMRFREQATIEMDTQDVMAPEEDGEEQVDIDDQSNSDQAVNNPPQVQIPGQDSNGATVLMPPGQQLDANGNPIPLLDPNGNPVDPDQAMAQQQAQNQGEVHGPEVPPPRPKRRLPQLHAARPVQMSLDHAQSLQWRKDFVLGVIPFPDKSHTLQARVVRVKTGGMSGKMFPTYHLCLRGGVGSDDVILLAAQKLTGARSLSSYYLITLDPRCFMKDASTFVAKLRSNMMGTEYTLFGEGDNPKKRKSFFGGGNKGGFDQEKPIREEMMAIRFSKPGNAPRRMVCVIPGMMPDDPNKRQIYRSKPYGCLLDHLTGKEELVQSDGLQFLRFANKIPIWDARRQTFTINFYGRVRHPSSKNFQLVADESVADSDPIVQFGRWSDDVFHIDGMHPFSCVQVFALALSMFDTRVQEVLKLTY